MLATPNLGERTKHACSGILQDAFRIVLKQITSFEDVHDPRRVPIHPLEWPLCLNG